MKQILKLIFLLVLGQTAFAQAPSNYVNINGRYRWIAGMFDSTFHIPKGTSPSLRTGGSTNGGALFFKTADSSLQVYTGSQWLRMLKVGDTTGMLLPYFNSVGVGLKNTGQTVYADTLLLSTRLWRNKGIDSVQANLTAGLATKVNISDTASMLSPYARTVNVRAIISDSLGGLARLKALNAAGAGIYSNSGTKVAEWGLGGGANFDFHGFAGYDINRAGSYTVRSFTDKNYVDSAISASPSGTVTSVATNNGSGITGGTITSTGTIAADTLLLSTRLWRQKGVDSVIGVLGSRVSGTTNYIPKFTSSSAIGNSQIFDDGTNVGLGTTTPDVFARFYTKILGLTSSGITAIEINGGSGSYAQIDLGAAGVRNAGLSASANETQWGSVTAIPAIIYTNNLERLRISSTGNVSIGNTNNTYKLDVTGTARFTSNVLGESSVTGQQGVNVGLNALGTDRMFQVSGTAFTSGTTQFAIVNNPTMTTPTTIYGYYGGLNVTSATNGYGIYITSAMGTITNKFGIYQEGTGDKNYFAGNVGIGTSPVNKLDVYGNIGVNTSGQTRIISTYYGANSDGANIFIGGGGLSSVGAVGQTYKGAYNTAIGVQALQSNTTGYYNTATGLQALYYNTTGYQNTAIGLSALINNTTGYNNSAIGFDAGIYTNAGGANQTSNNSVYLGFDTRASASGNTNEIVIGASARGNGSNSITLGNSSITKSIIYGEVLINTTTDAGDYKLQVNGNSYVSATSRTVNADIGSTAGDIFIANLNRLSLTSVPTIEGQSSTKPFLIGTAGEQDLRLYTNATERLKLKSTGEAEFSSSIKTAAPSGGTAKPWKLGEAGVAIGGSNLTAVKVEIDGTIYYLVTGYLPEPEPDPAALPSSGPSASYKTYNKPIPVKTTKDAEIEKLRKEIEQLKQLIKNK